MKKLGALIIILVTGIRITNGQCTSDYSYSGITDTLTFTNLSTVSNAHYYWNFGDGSGSNDVNPIHIFPDDGDYIVTLYVNDTVTNCSDVHETLINVTKPDTVPCDLLLDAYIQGTTIVTSNLSTNCTGYNISCGAGPGSGFCSGVWADPLWGASLFFAYLRASTNDSIYSYRLWKEYYNTVPYQFSSDTNFQNCSANFEVLINYQPNGALVTLTAMNKSGTGSFWIYGFGNTILLPGYTASYLYPYSGKNQKWIISYHKSDPANGCSSKTGTQNILIRNPYWTFPPNCALAAQPQPQYVNVGSTAQFIISAPANITKQWQQDAGSGYVNLTNAGPYSGVHTDTLTISNVQLSMSNYYYRCILADSSGSGCNNTSSAVPLFVQTVGINNASTSFNIINIYSNPTTNTFTITFPNTINTGTIEIYNVLGEKVFSQKPAAGNQQQVTIDVSNWNKGIYFVKVNDGEKQVVKKVVIQ